VLRGTAQHTFVSLNLTAVAAVVTLALSDERQDILLVLPRSARCSA
jgi:hypothetical protein